MRLLTGVFIIPLPKHCPWAPGSCPLLAWSMPAKEDAQKSLQAPSSILLGGRIIGATGFHSSSDMVNSLDLQA